MTFIKKPLFVNQPELDQQLNVIDAQREYFQEILTTYNNLGLNAPILENEYSDFIENPKSFISKKLSANYNGSGSSLQISNEKLFDILELPIGTIELVNKINNDKGNDNAHFNGHSTKWFHRHTSNFIVKDGTEVEICPKRLADLETTYTVFITTEKEDNANNIIDEIVLKINELEKLKSNAFSNLFTRYLNYNEYSGTTSKNPATISDFR